MPIVITGSREFKYLRFVEEIVTAFPATTVISGGARGVDNAADHAAWNAPHLTSQVEHAKWKNNGKTDRAAGFKRNIKMLDMLGDDGLVVGFWDGQSTGTLHCLDNAEKRNIPIIVYKYDDIQKLGAMRLDKLLEFCRANNITFIRFGVFVDEDEDLYDSVDNWYIEFADGSSGSYDAFEEELVDLLFTVQNTWPNAFATGIFEIIIDESDITLSNELENKSFTTKGLGRKLSKIASIDTEGNVTYLPKAIDVTI